MKHVHFHRFRQHQRWPRPDARAAGSLWIRPRDERRRGPYPFWLVVRLLRRFFEAKREQETRCYWCGCNDRGLWLMPDRFLCDACIETMHRESQ